MGVEGVRVLMPFDFVLGNAFDVEPDALSRYKTFYRVLLNILKHIRNDTVADSLVKKLNPHFRRNGGLNTGRRGTFSSRLGLNVVTFNSNVLIDYPIQPVEYDEQDSYGVLNSLITCGKVALMDKKEKIAAITTFLNQHQQKVTFIQGDGDSFFAKRRPDVRGWPVTPIRNNYFENRLKAFISSGILSHLKLMYNIWRPPNLLGHGTNWTGPKVDTVTGLDFSSKVTTGFYIWGICVIVCILLLIGEVALPHLK